VSEYRERRALVEIALFDFQFGIRVEGPVFGSCFGVAIGAPPRLLTDSAARLDSQPALSRLTRIHAAILIAAFALLSATNTPAQSLKLKPGCWEVQNHDSMQNPNAALFPEAIDGLISAQDNLRQSGGQPPMTADEKAKLRAKYEAANSQASQAPAKGGTTDQISCNPNLFADANADIYGPPRPQCTRSLQPSGQSIRAHIACPSRVVDYQRNSPESFASTTRTTHSGDTQTDVLTAKWISEAAPHEPTAPPATNLAGQIAKGPHAVAWLDPFRIVAIVDEAKITALQAYLLLHKVPPQTDTSCGSTESAIFEQVYLHYSIANQAEESNLDRAQPWSRQLADAGANTREARVAVDAIAATTDMDEMAAEERRLSKQEEAREKILWNAYFSQVRSDANRQALERRIRDKYKLTVVDPDFFAN
jgi:hypothetical protein